METQTKFVIFLTIWILTLKVSFQIYVPDDERNQKPLTYTTGIKTSSYSKPSQIQLHHNYSKVRHQNYDVQSQDLSEDEETSRRPYPVYDAHPYETRPQTSQQLTQVYVLNGTRIRKNPVRQIVMFNRQQRTPKIAIYKSCPVDATGQFVYESSCNQFLNCWKGRGYVQNCAPGTLFNPKSLECDWPDKVYCITGPRQNIFQVEKSAKSFEQVGCPNEFSGLIPNYTDCSKFINCVSGIENFMECPPGTLFDVNKNICDFEHKAACFNGQNSNLQEQKIDGKVDFGRTSSWKNTQQKQELRYRDNDVRCPSGFEGLRSHPNDCSKFLNCAHGQTYIQDCGAGTLFNPVLKICDFPYNVRCQNNKPSTVITDLDAKYYPQNKSFGQPTTTVYNHQYNTGFKIPETSGGGENHNLWSTDRQEQDNRRFNGQHDIYSSSNNQYGANSYNREQTSQTYGVVQPTNAYGNVPLKGRPIIDPGPTYYDPSPHHTIPNQGNEYYVNRGENQFSTGLGGQSSSSTNYDGKNKPATGTQMYTDTGYQYNRGSVGHGSEISSNSYRPTQYHRGSAGSEFGTYGQSTGQYDNSQRDWTQRQHIKGSTNQHNTYDISRQNNQNGLRLDQNYYTGNQNQPNEDRYDTTQNIWKPNLYNKGVVATYNQNGLGPDQNYNGGNQNQPNRDPYGTNQNIWKPNPYNQGVVGTYNQNGLESRDENTRIQVGTNWDSQQPETRNTNNSWRRDQYPQQGGSYNPGQGQTFNNEFGGLEQDLYKPTSTPSQRNDWQQGQRGETVHNTLYNQQNQWNRQNQNENETRPNYDQVVNINQVRKTTVIPFRNSYEPFYGPTTLRSHFRASQSHSNDYDDTFGVDHSNKYIRATTPNVVEKNWPPPFPSTDVNADYVFEYDEVTLEAENSPKTNPQKNGPCGKSDFRCSSEQCIPKTLICNGIKNCPDGDDEINCLGYVSQFSVRKNHKLAILEKERWDNVSIATCALLCVETQKFQCRSFNYRKIDKTCFLTNTNEGLTGALISYYPFDYYELIREKINCSDLYVCNNKKCIHRKKLCDGHDDCGDRMDEKGCKPEDFGYNIRLTGSPNKNEGQVEVTAFGKTGYVCDDQFGLRDADVVCRELGFGLGAVQVKAHSFYVKNVTTEKTFYMMDDVSCVGNETRLMDCDFSGWGVHNCLGQEILGVVCKTPQEKCPDAYWQCDTGQECLPLAFVCDGLLDCTDGSDEGSQHCDAPTEIRLVNGSSRQEGRLEIKHHGIWGTICDDDFNEDAAKVACKYLGYKGSATVRKNGYFGQGSGPIWLDQVFCSGNETNIETCSHWNWGEHNCEHAEDVGIICSNFFETERHSLIPMPSIPQVYPDRCGFRKDNIFNRNDDVHFRVVRGSVAQKGDYPWQAAIRVKGKTKVAHWCGAVVISEKFVLTAAHCLIGYSKGAYVVVAGDYNVDEDEGTEQEAYIEDFYLHENFRQDHKMNNDIALVKLKGHGFRLNEDVQAICLPDSDTSYETDLNCTISGFGSVESGTSAFSHNLRAGWVPIQKRQICKMPHVYGDALTEGMICAGSLDEGIDSCDGDSGGPLACLNNGVFTLFGITSWGQHCGYANKPGVYVKVAHYTKWIDDNFHKHATN